MYMVGQDRVCITIYVEANFSKGKICSRGILRLSTTSTCKCALKALCIHTEMFLPSDNQNK